jgi:hypothetical protein
VEQKGMLKGTKRKLLDAANTLGLSRETIGWVERRTYVGLLNMRIRAHSTVDRKMLGYLEQERRSHCLVFG